MATTRRGASLRPSRSTPGPDALETHISILIFIGDRAYKFHKPVRTAFLDHSTREKRRWACHEEVAVNRRFAPDVYLGVVDVSDENGRMLDHAVVMRRMPAERRLSSLLDDPETPAALASVARQLAAAHRDAAPVCRDGAGDWGQIRDLWEAGLEQVAPFAGEILRERDLETVDREAHRFLAGRRPLFDLRVATGHVRDGHGDLLADDIYCLDDGPRLLDALAFDPALRVGDTLSDAAFLAMDIASLGRPDLADEFLLAHTQALADDFPSSLAYHYLAYSAFVRAKIACLAAEQGREGKAERGRLLMELAADYLERGRVRMVLIGGPPGTGKSTLAAGLAEASDFRLIRTDVVRKDGGAAAPSHAPGFRRGPYAPDRTAAVYEEMLAEAQRELRLGRSVILDASWADPENRADARRAAGSCAADAHEVRCHVEPAVADRRILARLALGADPSDATVAVARRMRRDFADWPEAATVATDGPPPESVESAARLIGLELPQPAWALRAGESDPRAVAVAPGSRAS